MSLIFANEILQNIFLNESKNVEFLYLCLFVNKSWCISVIPILWNRPFIYCCKIINSFLIKLYLVINYVGKKNLHLIIFHIYAIYHFFLFYFLYKNRLGWMRIMIYYLCKYVKIFFTFCWIYTKIRDLGFCVWYWIFS
jgi:hypothetical protein